ncbi:MAG: glycosyl hydrolase 53 family protein [Opitutales bacterium]|nr:glycosyl hydrolase 53 family protein [Opitutales bacterium]
MFSSPLPLPGLLKLAACVASFALPGLLFSQAEMAFVYGADVSALPVHEAKGAVYRNASGQAADALFLLKEAGMDCMRLRLFVEPDGEGIVTNDLEYTLQLARRIKAAGLSLMLDIHYSDTWADPSHQITPAAWATLSQEDLVSCVESYTREVLERFVNEGLSPEYVQLGNEITNGMLWPSGQVEFGEPDEAAWDRLAALLQAARNGFLQAYGDAPLPVSILHIESTGNLPRTRWYLENVINHQLTYDAVGFSYYPQWHGSFTDLQQTLNLAAEITNKPVMVVETACPWKQMSDWDEEISLQHPFSPENQKAFLEKIFRVVRSVPENLGKGVFWWYPEAILTEDLHVWLGGDCALFDDEGRILPAAAAGSQ